MTLDPSNRNRKPRATRTKQLVVGPMTDWVANAAGVPDSQRTDTRTPTQRAAAHAAVPASAPQPSQHVAHDDPQVLSRQRALRAAGFAVAVDGIWGPQSQAAWSAYVNGHHPSSAPFASAATKAAAQAIARNRTAQRNAFAAQQTRKATAQARAAMLKAKQLAAQAQVAARTNAQIAMARSNVAKLHSLEPTNPAITQRLAAKQAQLQSRPSLAPLQHRAMQAEAVATELNRSIKFAQAAFAKPAHTMTPEELVATTVDPLTGNLDPNKPETVKRVQDWLVAHGHPQLKADGQWSKETNAALLATFHAMQRQEHERQTAEVADRFYKSGVVKVGQPLGPLSHAPAPAELLKVLQGGGLTALSVWRELQRRYSTSQVAFLHFQENQLDGIEAKLYPSWAPQRTLANLGVKESVQNRVHQLQIDAGLAVARGEMRPEAAHAFISQLTALGSATNADDLKRRLVVLKVQLDQEHQAAMHTAMGDKTTVHGFWGHTLQAFGVLGKPAHWVATGVESAAAAGDYELHHPDKIRLFRSHAENKQIDAAVASFQTKHPWMEVGLETVVDPLWLVDPLAIAGKAAKLGAVGALRMEEVGLRVVGDGSSLERIAAASVLTAPAELGRAFALAGTGAIHFAKGDTAAGRLLQLDHFYNVTRKLGTEKEKAVANARRRIRLNRRNGFQDYELPAELRQALDQRDPITRAELQRLIPIVSKHLSDNNLSLYSDIGRGTESVIGGEVKAFLTRHEQVLAHQSVAREMAEDAYVSTLFGKPEIVDAIRQAGMNPLTYALIVTKHLPLDSADADLIAAFRKVAGQFGSVPPVVSHTAALASARDAYREILGRTDFRGFGGHDVEMAQRLKPHLDNAVRNVEDAMRDLQDNVEARIEEIAKADPEHPGLFHPETGQAVTAGSDISRTLLGHAAQGFDDLIEVANHAFGKAHTLDERIALQQLELDAAVRSAEGTARRRAAEGMPYDEGYIATLANEKRAELSLAWVKRDGSWFDTRQALKVPSFYGSHLRLAFRHADPASLQHLPATLRDVLAVASGPGSDSPFVEELANLAYSLSYRPGLDSFGRDLVQGAFGDFVIPNVPPGSDLGALISNYRDALTERSTLLDKAEQVALPRELAREWALWAALQKAQSAPLRMTYKSLSAFLDVWLVSTLPLRPGFVVRNVIDNTAKMLADGAVDPRAYFPRASRIAGDTFSSVFQLGIQEMRYVLSLGGRLQKNPAIYYFDKLIDSFWNHDSDVLQSIFRSHDIEVPQAALEDMRFGASDAVDPAVFAPLRKVRNKLMHLMANIPENAAKRVLYRDTYFKAIRDGATEMEAFEKAMSRIDFVLFDYSKVTVIEDNLRFIFPFVQFWRKTTNFWVQTAAHTPGLPVAIDRFERTLRDKQNADLPEWMKRYVNLEPVAHTLARVPGLGWMTSYLLDGMQTDPMQFFSFTVLWRAFKNENPDMPADKQGLAFIGPFVDALNDWGLSMNPLVRKPAEFAGIFNYRAWQTVFPETGLFEAISRQFLGGSKFLNPEAWLEDKTLGLIGYDLGARQKIEQNFDQWVQLEMAAQAERGEPVDRAAAEAKIRHYYLAQTILGFFAGMYARRRDDADIFLYKLQEQLIQDPDAWNKLSKKDQRAYELFKRRKLDPIAFNSYLETEPTVEAYYTLNGTHDQREAFKAAHPEIIPFIDGWKQANVGGKSFVKTMPLLADTETAMAMLTLVQDINADFTIKQAARQMFVTRELQSFWDANDTPAQTRDKMLQGELHAHIDILQKAYFAIPETDHDARNQFLSANPMLSHYWTLNDSASDDLKGVMNSMNATLRERYFEYLDAKDYTGARDLLRRFPFIFEFTKAANAVNADGDWITYGGHAAKSQHARDYLAAKPYLDHFFALLKTNRAEAMAYANKTVILTNYFARWGKGKHTVSRHAQDYLAIKSTLTWFFNLLKTDKARAQAWLDSNSPEAEKVRAYFRTYSHSSGMTQHGIDYAAVKTTMSRYFNLQKKSKGEASTFLKAHPELEAYFKKYGHFTKTARNWKDAPGSGDPATDARLDFWKRYWTLEPDARPAFVAAHANDAGIFIYGSLSAKQREDSQREYLRQAMARKGVTEKMALYTQVKPLLDLYFTLQTPSDKDLFLRANPDVQNYLDNFTHVSTGDGQLDTQLQAYFQLDRHSAERVTFLQQHPKLQAYFDRNSSPADLAMRDLLTTYFKMPPGKTRSYFSAKHPEIQAYFDQRKAERNSELAAAMAFDLADPRVAPWLANAEAQSGHQAMTMLRLLRESVARNKFKDGLSRRVDRAPETPQ